MLESEEAAMASFTEGENGDIGSLSGDDEGASASQTDEGQVQAQRAGAKLGRNVLTVKRPAEKNKFKS